MNNFTCIGNLGADPEFRSTPSGRDMCRFRIAVDRTYYQADGSGGREMKKATDWLPIVVWGSQARTCGQYLQKGSKVSVQGSVRSHNWTDSEGQTHYVVEVHAEDVQFLAKIKSPTREAAQTVESTTDF